MLFLFFKQKTAYEMRISDWSSDVCSSDLIVLRIIFDLGHRALDEGVVRIRGRDRARIGDEGGRHLFVDPARRANAIGHDRRRARRQSADFNLAGAELVRGNRSEEHTSELQSLRRISYAVFWLKKKTIQTERD